MQHASASLTDQQPSMPAQSLQTEAPTSPGRHMALLRSNLLRTVNYCLLFSLVGMSDASLGAALPGLACLARTSEQRIAYLFLFHELSVLLVTLLVGWLNRSNIFVEESRPRSRLGVHLLLLAVATLMPCCFVLVPQCRSLTGLGFAFSAMGLLEGCLEFFCNAQMLRLYRSEAGPFLQAMFFFQSLGAFVSPLIIGAFLSNPAPHEWLNCTLSEAQVAAAEAAPKHPEVSAASVYLIDEELESVLASVRYPFFVIAVIQTPIMASMCVLTYKEAARYSISGQEILSGDDGDEGSTDDKPAAISASTCCILLFASLCAFALDGILGSYSSLIFAFSMRSVRTREERGKTAYLPATFWGFTLIGRLSGIFLSLKLSSTSVLLIDMVGLIAAGMLFLLGQERIGILFVATAATGFFVSHCMPALLARTEQLIQVTKDATICLISSAAFGEALLPVVMASVMHGLGTGAYPIGHFGFVILACCLCCLYIGVGHRAIGGSKRESTDPPPALSMTATNYGSQLNSNPDETKTSSGGNGAN